VREGGGRASIGATRVFETGLGTGEKYIRCERAEAACLGVVLEEGKMLPTRGGYERFTAQSAITRTGRGLAFAWRVAVRCPRLVRCAAPAMSLEVASAGSAALL
jgi:hypothetical protein